MASKKALLQSLRWWLALSLLPRLADRWNGAGSGGLSGAAIVPTIKHPPEGEVPQCVRLPVPLSPVHLGTRR